MDYSDISKKYEDFLKHDKFPEIEQKADLVLKNADLKKSDKKQGNWTYNLAFLSNYFDKPKHRLVIDTADRITIVVGDKEINLNTNEAPNFRDQDEYVKWLHTQLNK